MARNVHHLENRSAIGRGGCQKARSKRMAGEDSWRRAGAAGVGLDNIGHRSVAKTARRHHAAFIDRPEYRPCFDTGSIQPGPESLYRAGRSPREIAMVSPSPSWSVLLCRIVTSRPVSVSSISATSSATSSERRKAPPNPRSRRRYPASRSGRSVPWPPWPALWPRQQATSEPLPHRRCGGSRGRWP